MSLFYISDGAPTDATYDPDVSVLVVSGELDYSASPHLDRRIVDHLKAGKRRLIVDLSAVTFIDSMAIGVLVRSASRLRDTGGSLRVVCAEENERVLRIFDIAGVASSIPLDRSPEEALSGPVATPSAAALPVWAEQATIAAAAGRQLSSGHTGLAAARRYAVEASTRSEADPAGRRHPGGTIDRLA
jgi:anti-anti-sigma factor